MRKYLLIGVLSLIIPCSIFPQDYSIDSTLFIPPTFYVGDQVELRVEISPTPGTTIISPRELPELSWMTYHSVVVDHTESGVIVEIKFSSYHPGTRTLPEIDLGDITLGGMKIHTASLLEERDLSFVNSLGQMILPGTRTLLAVLGSLIIGGPILVLSVMGNVRRKLLAFLKEQKVKKPYKQFEKGLNELAEGLGTRKGKDFYIELTSVLRKYLEQRSGKTVLSITTEELDILLSNILNEDQLTKSMVRFMRFGDEVKFSGVDVTQERIEEDLNQVFEFGKTLEVLFQKSEHSEEKPHADL
jgi:hypothetical protein